MRRGRWLIAAIVAAWLAPLALGGPQAPAGEPAPELDRARRAVRIPAVLRLEAFAGGDPPGHHLITWRGGRAGHKALLRTPVSDRAVLEALEGLGGEPGNTLTAETWSARDDPAHPDPDLHAEGSLLAIELILADGVRQPVQALLEDVDERGYAWRLAGNARLIPVWRSGCVVCLQSCPGSKIANARATIRDLHRGRSRFRASAWARELGEGRELTIELRLLEEGQEKER